RDARRRGMRAIEQRGEVETLVAGDHQLAVGDEVAAERTQRLDDLGEVASEWPAVAAAQLDVTTLDEREATQTIPLRLVQIPSDRQLALQRRQHRLGRAVHAGKLAPLLRAEYGRNA